MGWVFTAWIGGILLIVSALMIAVYYMSPELKNSFSTVAGNVALLLIIVAIIIGGVWKKVSVFDAFIEGAKEGFNVVVKIIPYLVGMLVAIRVFATAAHLATSQMASHGCCTRPA